MENLKNDHSFLIRDLAFYKNKAMLGIKFCAKSMRRCFLKEGSLSYPKTLQLPITNACNLDCVMCNIHANERKVIPLETVEKQIVCADVLKEIQSVGINGGEPFLLHNIEEYVKCILMLPSIQNIFIISNGVLTDRILEKAKLIKTLCAEKGVKFTLSFSLDGIGEKHDEVRNRKGTYEALMKTVTAIRANLQEYSDSLNFICTISKYNVEHLGELDFWAKKEGITINYNIATIHQRLKNDNKYEDFSILNDRRASLLAAEFFYKKFQETNLAKYYALFLYLYDTKNIRCGACQYLHSAITLTPEGDVCYCATHSKVLGNIFQQDISEIYFNNVAYNKELEKKYCKNCSHYIVDTNMEGDRKIMKERLKRFGKGW